MDNSLIAPNQDEELHKLFGTELIELFNKYDFVKIIFIDTLTNSNTVRTTNAITKHA